MRPHLWDANHDEIQKYMINLQFSPLLMRSNLCKNYNQRPYIMFNWVLVNVDARVNQWLASSSRFVEVEN